MIWKRVTLSQKYWILKMMSTNLKDIYWNAINYIRTVCYPEFSPSAIFLKQNAHRLEIIFSFL
jgi:hypothetical protein